MDYVIKIGTKFIGYNSYGQCAEVVGANNAITGSMHKMTNILNNSVSPSKRKQCKVVRLEDAITSVIVEKPVIHEAKKNNTSLFDDVISQLKKLDIPDYTKEQSELSNKLSKIDQEISDVQHYIEFNRLNAAEGYKAFKLLQDKLLERRVIKNDFAKFHILNDAKVSDIFDGTLENQLNELNNRIYTPRVLKELFVTNDERNG